MYVFQKKCLSELYQFLLNAMQRQRGMQDMIWNTLQHENLVETVGCIITWLFLLMETKRKKHLSIFKTQKKFFRES